MSLAVSKRGIYRSATGVIDALSPSVDTVTVRLLDAVASTTQRVYFPSGIKNIKGVMSIQNAAEDFAGSLSGRAQSVYAWYDGTNHFCVEQWVDSETAALTMKSLRGHNTLSIARFSDVAPYTSAPNRSHAVTGFGDGYVDIQTLVDTSAQLDRYITLRAFGGDEITGAEVWTLDDLGTGTSAVPVSGLAITPSMTYIATVDESTPLASFNDSTLSGLAESKFSVGWALNQDGTPQGCYGIAATNNEAAPVSLATVISNTKCLSVVTDAGSINYSVTCGSWTSSGFSLTPSSSASNAICGGMALELSDDFNVEMFNVTIPGTSGNYTQTVTGVSEDALIWGMHGATSYNAATTASAMCEIITSINSHSISTAMTTYVSGITDNDAAARSRLDRELFAWEWNGSAQSQILASSGYTITDGEIEATLTTNPSSNIIGIGLSFYT